ncbi:HSP90 family protein [Saccharopolyspora shandongensis]|uniref:HSP90 family protein n=1 Tax=Saccharopolyspora shandongensis TaxID=418495 RepID=UPI0033FB0776
MSTTAPEPGNPAEQVPARPFQVDLRGVVDLLSRHIYASPQVFLRELLQNGRDAIEARRLLDPAAPEGRMRIAPAAAGRPDFTFSDNGIGLTAAEATDLLATVGRSSKRDEVLNLRREDYLGQFGIGLLSCFMVSDHITVLSRSARGDRAIEWVGRAEGTFHVRELPEDQTDALPIGTTVRLTPRPDEAEMLSANRVRALATRFGQYLPHPVEVAAPDGTRDTITRAPVFLDPHAHPEQVLELGTEIVGAKPLAAFPVEAPGTGTRGVAFVLPYAPPPGGNQANRVYLGRMLLSERVDDLLPDWGFFVRCVLDTTDLKPTASRESFVGGDDLEHTRTELGAQLRRWLLGTARTDPHLFGQVMGVHQQGMKALAVHDADLARILFSWLTVETSAGTMKVTDYTALTPRVRYTETVDEFRQIAAVIPADAPIVNAGYAFDADLLRQLVELTPGLTLERVNVTAELDNLNPPPLADRQSVVALEDRATAVLADSGAEAAVRMFAPADLPALYVADPEVLRHIERSKATDVAPTLWAGLVSEADAFMAKHAAVRGADATARLCLNWSNPLVRQLADVRDEAVFSRSVRLVYLQAMLAGHRPLSARDRRLLTTTMTDLVHLSIGFESDLA